MKRIAMIDSGAVFNVAIWNGTDDWKPNCKLVDVTDQPHVEIGYTYENGVFVKPDEEPTESE